MGLLAVLTVGCQFLFGGFDSLLRRVVTAGFGFGQLLFGGQHVATGPLDVVYVFGPAGFAGQLCGVFHSIRCESGAIGRDLGSHGHQPRGGDQ